MSERLDYQSNHSHGLEPLPRPMLDIGRTAELIGVISFVLLLIGLFFSPAHAFRSLYFAWHYWLSITLGCLGFVMISHLTGGGWGAMMRRVGEAGFMNLPYMLVVFLPLALGYKYLFPWAHISDFPDKVPHGVLEHRDMLYGATVLGIHVFTIRTLIYFFIWFALAFTLRSGSLQLDQGPDLVLRRKLRKVSAGGMVLFFVTTTGYALDYVLSRETNWYSSIIGFIIAVSMGMSGMAFISLNMCYLADKAPFKGRLNAQHLNDYGNILLALVILWMYTSFAQFLIQWNGNIPDDIMYYTHRGIGWPRNLWAAVALTLLIGQFFIPFFLLLQKPLKRKPSSFILLAGWLLLMRAMDALWITAPSGAYRDVAAAARLVTRSSWWHGDDGGVYLTDIFAFAAVGGIWIAIYMRNLASKPLIAKNIADLPEIAVHGHPSHA
jgi:hypothetical protein